MNYYDIVKKDKKLSIEFEGGIKVNVVYDATWFNPDNADYEVGTSNKEIMEAPAKRLASGLLIDWDLDDGKGNKIGLDFDTLKKLHTPFLSCILAEIQNDAMQLKKK